jgi:CheY-like chemotaxis protein
MANFNILHLEDEYSIRTSMRDIFDILIPQASVVQFSNTDDALEYVTHGHPEVHLFLLDVRVPGKVDGIGFASELRQLGYTSMIAFVSAYSKPNSEALSGVLEYSWLSKPIDLDALLKVMTQAEALV